MTQTDDLFGNIDDQDFDLEKNYLDQLVGEGKKYKDPNSLAYSRLEADRFIERLKHENDTMRKELEASEQLQTANQRLEELVTKLSTGGQQQSTSNANNQERERDGVASGLTPEQAESLVERKLIERTNLEKSMAAARKTFGEDYQPKLDSEAKKLGLSREYVNTIAKTNPAAFERLFAGHPQQTQDVLPPPRSSTVSSHTSNSQDRTQKYYSELKRTNPALYRSKEIQLQEYKDAMRLGERFFD